MASEKSVLGDLLARARAWLQHDPDPATRRELAALIEAAEAAAADAEGIGARALTELTERFVGPLAFGTAGLRGVIGAGESRMNRAVVLRTAAGLARYLLEHEPDAKTHGVVIGYDGRRQSDVFANDTAAVLTAAGITVHLSAGVCPTPMVAFAVTELGAVAGVMVTASHNPPAYNGYKVYARNGAQIIPPADTGIAAAVLRAGHADEISALDLAAARQQGLLKTFGEALEERYLAAIAGLIPKVGDGRAMAIVYTPLHGVGAPLLERAFENSGFSGLRTVAEQREPDGAFPTVAFPNPEEEGALDLSLALAKQHDAPLILANDPDADRLAAAVRTAPGSYTQLTGNEVGALLGYRLLNAEEGADRMVLTTIVSSPLLGVMARAMGVAYGETLTGFKWIANKAMRTPDKRFVFGYEEALGYTVGTIVRDKDGIGTALVLAALAAELNARGETLLDELERIARRYGLYASAQRSLNFAGADGKSKMASLMQKLRDNAPAEIAGRRVLATTDISRGLRMAKDRTEPVDLPSSDVLIFELEGGDRIIARPSGTEPKMKIYCDVCEAMRDDDTLEEAKARAHDRCEALGRAMLARLA